MTGSMEALRSPASNPDNSAAMTAPQRTRRLQAVIFDWAGTTLDFGSLAPVAAFVEVFAGSRPDGHLEAGSRPSHCSGS
jgi:hypothetical protein